jgi:phosphoserine/homoserine phosphotransferase|tara:strand:- start:138 stop:752 length:615 start_codon:yes stop_codon:yes gene_type:complete
MEIVCLDLEGVLVPEIWIAFAEITGIEGLRATTRDMPDYRKLMNQRLGYLEEHQLGLADIQAVVDRMTPIEGAREFLDWLRERFQVVILSDTFYEFASPLIAQLGWPTLFCNRLETDRDGNVVDYHIRQEDPKRKSVQALASLNYRIMAVGDSYNDVSMLEEAAAGFLFRPPQQVIDEYPQYPVVTEYAELQELVKQASTREIR